MRELNRYEWLLIALVLLVGGWLRAVHMSGPLDESSWRQAWSAYQARQLSRESPPDLLRVKINYKGTNDVSVWNFPIYEGVTALAYKSVGGENLFVARLVTLAFFSGALAYLFLAVRKMLGVRIAAYASAVYWILPLNLFYSRAVHYDIPVIFFCHAFFFHALRFSDRSKWFDYATAVAAASCAFLMKPPYCFYFCLPIAAWIAFSSRERKFGRLVAAASMFIVPLALGWGYHLFRLSLEAGGESSILNPVPYTRDYAKSWFFGMLDQRLDPAKWYRVFQTIFWRVVSPLGAFAALWSLMSPERGIDRRGLAATWGWLAGTAAFVLLMFPMVASNHEYYYLPLLAPAAVLIGMFLSHVQSDGGWRGAVRGVLVVGLLLGGGWIGLKRHSYFARDWQRIAAGAAIKQSTESSDLVVSTTLGRSTGSVDPRILYFADRRGWVSTYGDLSAENIDTYRKAGARYVALLLTARFKPEDESFPILSGFPRKVVALNVPPGTESGWLVLFDLQQDI